MNSFSLSNLNNVFNEVIQKHEYIGFKNINSHPQFFCSKEKGERLSTIFKQAHAAIQSSLKGKTSLKSSEIAHLKELQKNGELLHNRYNEATSRWIRTALKCIARYTPKILKFMLPSYFSNCMEQAESKTHQAYLNFSKLLTEKLKLPHHDPQPAKLEKEGSDIFDPNEEEQTLSPSEDEQSKEKSPQKDSEKRKDNSALNDLEKKRLRIFDSKNDDDDLALQKALAASLLQPQSTHSNSSTNANQDKPHSAQPPRKYQRRRGYSEEEVAFLQNKIPTQSTFASLFEDDDDDAELQKAVAASLDNTTPKGKNKTVTFAQPTPSSPPVEEIASNKEDATVIEASLKTIENGTKTVNNFQNRPISLSQFKKILLSLYHAIQNLAQFKRDDLTAFNSFGLDAATQEILRNKDLFVAFATGNDQKLLDLLSLTPWKAPFEEALNQKGHFVKLGIRKIPEAIALQLVDEKDRRVNEKDFQNYRGQIQIALFDLSQLNSLDACIEFLNKNSSCTPYSLVIKLPENQTLNQPLIAKLSQLKDRVNEIEILEIKEVNISSLGLVQQETFDFDQFSYLTTIMPHMTTLNLDNMPLSDDQCLKLFQLPIFNHVQSLSLQGCEALTTDILPSLSECVHLSHLSLPALKPGKLPFEKLPTFDDPFQIRFLYGASSINGAAELYRGPVIWSALFQIPLARKGAKEIFPASQKQLDPKSVAYWLECNDYQYLTPQEGIIAICADSNTKLNDDNIVEFMKKFPKTRHLGVLNCPNVTEKGVESLFAHFEKIRIRFDNKRWTGGTKTAKLVEPLSSEYIPHQKEDGLILIETDRQLQECLQYHELSNQILTGGKWALKKTLGENYLHNRISVELFHPNPQQVEELKKKKIDIHSLDFCNISLFFRTQVTEEGQEAEEPTPFHTYRDLLSYKSKYFFHQLQEGGVINHNRDIDIFNIHATPQAIQAMIQMISGTLDIYRLEWKTAADLAELIGPNNFKFPSIYYKALLNRIHAQFDFDNAEDLFTIAQQLDDQKGMELYEQNLILFLKHLEDDKESFLKISKLAKEYPLPELSAQIQYLEEIKNQQLIEEELKKQHEEEEKLSQSVVKKLQPTSVNLANLWDTL